MYMHIQGRLGVMRIQGRLGVIHGHVSQKKAMFSNKNLSMSRMHFQEAQMPHDYIY